jgi:hypothetical protein
MVIATLFLTGTIGGGKKTVTTIPQTSSTPTTTIPRGGITTIPVTTQNTTSTIFSYCLSHEPTVAVQNGDFATGTYAGWNATGPGFGSVPFNLTNANSNVNPNYTGYYGAPWSGYNGTFFATSFQTGETIQTGNLTSLPFEVSELYLNFKIISQQDSNLYVEILKGGIPAIVTHYNTYISPPGVQNPQSTFVNASIPVGTLLCQNVSIRLVAGIIGKSSQGTDYIAAGDFYQSATSAVNPTEPVNQTFT